MLIFESSAEHERLQILHNLPMLYICLVNQVIKKINPVLFLR